MPFRCLVFDDADSDLAYRLERASEAVERLHNNPDEPFELDGEVEGFTNRNALLWALTDDERPVLLLTDLFSDAVAGSGGIGARILRAVAQHTEVGPRTRRIVWSKHTTVTITEALALHAHAFARFDPGNIAGLVAAISHATTDPLPADALVFPVAVPPEEWNGRVKAVITRLVGEPKTGDDLIAGGIARDKSNFEIQRELDQIEGPHRPDPTSFVNRVQEKRSIAATARARAIIKSEMLPVAMKEVPDGIPVEEVDRAITHRQQLLAAAPDQASYLATTWLTAPEDQLLHRFLMLYADRVRDISAGALDRRRAEIQNIIGAGFDPPHPQFADLAERLGMTAADVGYAVWTLADLRENR